MSGCTQPHVITEDVGVHQINGYVGFSNYPNQIHRKCVKAGFSFTLMLVGQSGLGKSTLANCLFNTKLFSKETAIPSEQQQQQLLPKSIEIRTLSADIIESGINLHLNIVDVPGFGDLLNNEECWKPVLENIEARFAAIFDQEQKVNRKKIIDNRVHALIYTIPPTGQSLRPLDIEFMKRVCHRVNIILVIAKADSLTMSELTVFKQRILSDLDAYDIKVYKPSSDVYDDEESIKEAGELIARMPFAVIASEDEVSIGGRKVRARVYPWGSVEIENENYSDFIKLQQLLVRCHMEDLREVTNKVLYEKFRAERMTAISEDSANKDNINIFTKIEEEKKAHEAKMQRLEAEMQTVFAQKVADKERKLQQTEADLKVKHQEMKDFLEKQRAELEEQKKKLKENGSMSSGNANKSGSTTPKSRKFFK